MDGAGRASMVGVGGKAITSRAATATGTITLGSKAFHLIQANQVICLNGIVFLSHNVCFR